MGKKINIFDDPRSITNDMKAQEVIALLQAELMGYHFASESLKAKHPDIAEGFMEDCSK